MKPSPKILQKLTSMKHNVFVAVLALNGVCLGAAAVADTPAASTPPQHELSAIVARAEKLFRPVDSGSYRASSSSSDDEGKTWKAPHFYQKFAWKHSEQKLATSWLVRPLEFPKVRHGETKIQGEKYMSLSYARDEVDAKNADGLSFAALDDTKMKHAHITIRKYEPEHLANFGWLQRETKRIPFLFGDISEINVVDFFAPENKLELIKDANGKTLLKVSWEQEVKEGDKFFKNLTFDARTGFLLRRESGSVRDGKKNLSNWQTYEDYKNVGGRNIPLTTTTMITLFGPKPGSKAEKNVDPENPEKHKRYMRTKIDIESVSFGELGMGDGKFLEINIPAGAEVDDKVAKRRYRQPPATVRG
jgi:hypothetical protein